MSSPLSLSAFGPPKTRGRPSPSSRGGRGPGVVGESGGGLFVDERALSEGVGIRVLKLDPNEGAYCGGQVGKGGSKMCIRSCGECTIQSHTRNKASIKILGVNPKGSVDGVFTDTKTPMVVYTTDVLPVDQLRKSIGFYAQDRRPPSKWGELFRTLADCPEDAEDSDLDVLSEVHEEMLGSPFKKPRIIDLEHGSVNGVDRSSIEMKLAHLAQLIGKQGDGSSTESILAHLARLEGLVEKGTLGEEHVIAIESLISNYGKNLEGLQKAAGDLALQNLQAEISPMLDKLERTTQDLLGPAPHPTPQTTRLQTPLFRGFAPTPGRTFQGGEIGALENQIKLLQEKVDTLQEQVAGDAVSIGGVIFRSKNELRSWLRKNMKDDHMYMCFADPCAILNMASSQGTDNASVLNFYSAARKAGRGEGYITLAELSFSFTLPLIFVQESGKPIPTAVRDSRTLPRMKTADAYDNGNRFGGAKIDMLSEIDVVQKMFDATLTGTDLLSAEAHRVATVCISQSMVFIHSLFTWMSSTYFGGVADGQAGAPLWGYISHCVRALFKSLHGARRSGQRPNPEPADCVWGFFQGLKMANEFSAAGFSGHPVLSHVLNLHLHDRAVMKEGLEDRLKEMQKTMEKTVADVKRSQQELNKRVEEAVKVAKTEEAIPSKRAKYTTDRATLANLPGFPEPVAGLISHRLSPSDVRVGVLADAYPTALWYLGMVGKPMWVVSNQDIPARGHLDPPWHAREVCPIDLERVDVLVIQGRWPRKTSNWWRDTGASLILRVSQWSERGGRKFPEGWSVYNDVIRHDHTGGLSDGRFRRWWAVPRGSKPLAIGPPAGLPNTLSQVLKPTVRSNDWCDVPSQGELNTGRGLLHWESGFGAIKSPSVFRRDQWVQRELTGKEIENILDFPENRGAKLTPGLQAKLIASEIPGKIWVAGLSVITVWSLDRGHQGKRKRESDEDTGSANDGSLVQGSRKAGSMFRGSSTEEYDDDLDSGFEGVHLHLSLKAGDDAREPQLEGSTVTAKAVKADGAAVPVHLWDNRVASFLQAAWARKGVKKPPLDFDVSGDRSKFQNILNNVRKQLLRVWKRRVTRSFTTWFKSLPSTIEDREKIKIDGLKACQKASEATWWEWDGGSSIFFWRWPSYYQEAARIGVAPFYDSDPPSNRDEQPPYGDEAVRLMVRKKLEKVLRKSYIELCDIEDIEAMMYMFHVPKGADDIRMVYDGSKSGLNDSLWAPWFALPNIDTMARWVVVGSWLADNDYGEQFLNFPLHPDLQRYCGVDLTQLFPEWKDPNFRLLLGRWTRNAMGLKPSPYNSVQGALIAKHVILGHPKDFSNPFSWDCIKLNLPGSLSYDAALPWIMKIRKDGLPASGLVQYIDDLRTMASTKELAWQCSSRMAKGLSYLGLQDAARKRRECTQTPGAWAGAVITTGDGLFKSVTQERWEKTQAKIRRIGAALTLVDQYSTGETSTEDDAPFARPEGDGEVWVHFKALERITGFLVYVGMTYSTMVPYIKGLHLTLNSWRPNRDAEGWKLRQSCRVGDHGPPPEYVRTVPRFQGDVKALMRLTEFSAPPKVPVRALINDPLFVVGDASGSGFGVSTWRQGSKVIHVTHGNWSERVTQESSSNFREAANLAMELRRLLSSGRVSPGTEVWVFTDNSCAERTFYKGSSTSPLLHDMVLDLRRLEMEGSLIIHYVWISGKRMISQGTDGLSRGDFTSGVMAGEDFLNFIPINESALVREAELESTIKSWGLGEWQVASPRDWFYNTRAKRDIGWIWAPPPCLARVALDELCEARHMFPYTSHIFVCPALMTGYWRKDLGKLADVMFTVEAGSTIWSDHQFEPLTIAFVCPLMQRYPWAVGRLSSLDRWRHKLSALFQGDKEVIRGHMRKLWRSMASGQGL